MPKLIRVYHMYYCASCGCLWWEVFDGSTGKIRKGKADKIILVLIDFRPLEPNPVFVCPDCENYQDLFVKEMNAWRYIHAE